MAVTFSFKEESSPILGTIKRPIAVADFYNKREKVFQPITLVVDTGADYTLLPKFFAPLLGINLEKECKKIKTQGVGGYQLVYFSKDKLLVKLGDYERKIPLGFLNSNLIPPLLGRHEFFETFRVVFEKYEVSFEESS